MTLDRKKILMISESPYPEDTRIKNEATALTTAGFDITIIALNFNKRPFFETLGGVHVYRLPMITIFKKSHSKSNWLRLLLYRIASAAGYILEYIYFTSLSFLLSLYIAIRHGVDVIHLHNPPNTLVVTGAFFRFIGKLFVFDHHDLAPELYLSKYNVKKDLLYRMLLFEEKLCLRFAHMVIATNESYKAIDTIRGGIDPEKIIVVRNGPDPLRFKVAPPDPDLKAMGKTILAYVGIMGPQDGVDYMLRALHHLAYNLGRYDFYCVIIGPGDAVDDLISLCQELELEPYVRFTGFISKADLLTYLSTADICLDPNPSSPLNDVSTWIKVMEYMALGKPVVSFDLKETRYTAQDAAVYVPPNDIEEFAKAVAQLMDDPVKRENMGLYGRKRIDEALAWKYSAEKLIRGYDRLISGIKQIQPSIASTQREIKGTRWTENSKL